MVVCERKPKQDGEYLLVVLDILLSPEGIARWIVDNSEDESFWLDSSYSLFDELISAFYFISSFLNFISSEVYDFLRSIDFLFSTLF